MPEHRIYRFSEWIDTPYKHVIRKICTDTYRGEKADPVEHEGRMDESFSRSRRLITEYILCNRFDLFCTFTFSKATVHDRKDYKAIKSKLCKFFNNFKNRVDPTFKYLVVPELHKDGSVHFHGVITAPVGLCTPLQIPKRDNNGVVHMVPNTPGYMDWPPYSGRFGFFSCSWIRNYTGCALYVSKYMTKDLAQWFERNDQIVMHSKGLNKPELVYCEPGYQIPGDKRQNDFDGDFCATGMRDAWETADYYVSGDDNWQRFYDRAQEYEHPRKPVTPRDCDMPPPLMDWGLFNSFPVDDWEQVSMRAYENGGNQ